MGMAHAIEMVMLSVSARWCSSARRTSTTVAKGTVFRAGMQAVIAIFGIAWLGDTFFQSQPRRDPAGRSSAMVREAPWLFAVALFVMSILLYSQAATIRALDAARRQRSGCRAFGLIGSFPAVNGYFFIPNYPTVVAAINFDRTGTTRIGK